MQPKEQENTGLLADASPRPTTEPAPDEVPEGALAVPADENKNEFGELPAPLAEAEPGPTEIDPAKVAENPQTYSPEEYSADASRMRDAVKANKEQAGQLLLPEGITPDKKDRKAIDDLLLFDAASAVQLQDDGSLILEPSFRKNLTALANYVADRTDADPRELKLAMIEHAQNLLSQREGAFRLGAAAEQKDAMQMGVLESAAGKYGKTAASLIQMQKGTTLKEWIAAYKAWAASQAYLSIVQSFAGGISVAVSGERPASQPSSGKGKGQMGRGYSNSSAIRAKEE